MAEELRFMVCMRVDEVDEPMPGSTTTACVECGTDIWQAPDSKKFASEMKAMPLCSTCAIKLAGEHKSAVHEFGHPGGSVAGESVELLEDLVEKLKGAADHYQGFDLPPWMQPSDEDTFEGLKKTAQAAARAMKEPDEDWGTIVVMEGWDGTLFPPVSLSDMLRMGIPKHVLAEQLLPGLAYTAEAKRVFYGISSWGLVGEKGNPFSPEDLDGPISEHPDAQEMLVLMELTADGVANLAHAIVTRNKVGPPILGEWKDSEKPAESDGLFVGAMVEALKAIKKNVDRKRASA